MITESEALSLVLLGRDFIVEQGERGVDSAALAMYFQRVAGVGWAGPILRREQGGRHGEIYRGGELLAGCGVLGSGDTGADL